MKTEFKRFFQGFQVVVLFSLMSSAANIPGRFPAQSPASPASVPSVDSSLTGLFDASTDVPMERLKLVEDLIFKYSNNKRIAAGLAPYPTDPKLTLVARAKSQDMAVNHYFAHTSPSGKVLEDRIDAFQVCGGKDCPVVGENLSNTNFGNPAGVSYWLKTDDLADKQANTTVDGLMSDAGHRGNILDTDFDEMAVGVSLSDDGALYVTQDFVRFTPLSPKSAASQ